MASEAEKLKAPVAAPVSRNYLKYSKELLNVSTRAVVIRAALSTVAAFGLLWALKIVVADSIPAVQWITTLFTERSPIQYVTTFTFFAGIWFLFLKLPKITQESNGFKLLDFPELQQFPLGADSADIVSKKIAAYSGEQRQLVIVRRVDTALRRLIHTNSTSEVHDVLDTMSVIDREIADASYRQVRFAVWVIPVAGFLGTVLGISQAISGFASIVSAETTMNLTEVKPILAQSTQSLGIAFDTTLLALSLSAVLMLTMYVVQRQEEVFLSAVDEFCISEIVNRLYVQDPGTTRLLGGLEKLGGNIAGAIEEMSLGLRGDFGKLAGSLGDDDRLPELIDTIRERFESFMTARDKSDGQIKKRFDELLANLSNIVDRGKAVEGFVAGLGEIVNLEEMLKGNQKAIRVMVDTVEKQQERMIASLAGQHKQTQEALATQREQTESSLAEQAKQLQAVIADSQKQTADALSQNKLAFDELLPPIKELSTGIKIKVGE